MKNLHLDFETYSEYDIRLGAYKYSEHPSTECLMAAFSLDDGPVKLWVNTTLWEGNYDPSTARYDDLVKLMAREDVLVWAHNVSFEKAIIENVLGIKLDITRYRCTAGLSRSLALHGDLAGASIDLGLVEKKDKAGSALIRKFSLPRKPTKHDPRTRIYGWQEDAILDFEDFCDYCIQDVKTERAIHERLKAYEFKKEELAIFQVDLKLNERGVPIDHEAVNKGLEVVKEYSDREADRFRQLSKRLQVRTEDAEGNISYYPAMEVNPTQTAKAMERINSLMPEESMNVENLQAGTVDQWLLDNKRLKGSPAYEMLKIRRSLGRSSTKKLQAMINTSGKDNRVRGSLLYHVATTGRWGGRLIQPQNLPRPSLKNTLDVLDATMTLGVDDLEFLYGDPMAAISSVIRHYIAAPPGRDLIVADYSAIEARVLCWLAGQDDAVVMFQREVDARREWQDGIISEAEYKDIKRGSDTYIDMASVIYDKHPLEIDDDERWLGKASVLGCGYQMWWKSFQAAAENAGREISDALSERAVKAYRSKYNKVVQLWSAMEQAALEATVSPGKLTKCGRILFKHEDGFLFMKLPSGRKLSYPRAQVVMEMKYGKKKPTLKFYGKSDTSVFWGMKSTYGGKLTENACQAIGRDLMGNGMVNVEEAGYDVLTSIHDEAMSEVDEGWGSVMRYERLLCKQPSWADGIPLASEGYRAKRYRK